MEDNEQRCSSLRPRRRDVLKGYFLIAFWAYLVYAHVSERIALAGCVLVLVLGAVRFATLRVREGDARRSLGSLLMTDVGRFGRYFLG